MPVLEEILEEEYGRTVCLSRAMKEEYLLLPKGSVRTRVIRGHEYYYLNYREGKKVRSDYIPASKVEEVRVKVKRRKVLKAALREQEQVRRQIERVLGRRPHAE